MSRTRRATIAAAFGYAQFGLALIIGIGLVPLMLDRLGTRTWGLWLATGELLAYAGMVDLGVLGVLPWLVAEKDGRRDRDGLRRLISSGVAVGLLIGAGYALLALVLWRVLPSVLHLTPLDRAVVGPPLVILVAFTALSYPLRAFPAALLGLQDMTFYGLIRIVQSALDVLITVVLLLKGYGLYALAWGTVVPTAVLLVASLIRLRIIAPDLLKGWTRPAMAELSPIVFNGFGVWLAGFGWLLLSSSNALVITFLGHPDWVPIFNCTAKVSLVATQLVWLMPDSGLVGLAQLHGEAGSTPRVRHVVALLQQVHLLLAGAAACAILGFNPTFVTHWVGSPLFGGLTLNILLASGIVVYSLVHALTSAASTLGNRVQVGILTLVNGAVQVPAAIVLGRILGLEGIALGGLIAAAITSIPVGLMLLKQTIGLSASALMRENAWPWLMRAVPVAFAAALLGVVRDWLGFWLTGLATGLALVAYVWHMRPLYSAVLALDPRWTRWLAMLRLAPPVGADVPPTAVPLGNQS
jgi:O-antigen/teichoic acid export membrane protein